MRILIGEFIIFKRFLFNLMVCMLILYRFIKLDKNILNIIINGDLYKIDVIIDWKVVYIRSLKILYGLF